MPPTAPEAATAVTIGNFDGVHLGHAALVRRCRSLVGEHGRVCVLAFDPHPMTKLRPALAPARLSTFEQRAASLIEVGADEVVRLIPDDQLLGKPARDFVAWLTSSYSPRFIVEGDDFHFGKGRSGTTRTLQELGGEFGFTTDIVPPVEIGLGDDLVVRASSSIVRWLITQGRVSDAARVLGRPYELAGTVVKGDQRGRTIGFPTANLRTECLLPADGVYAGEAELPDGRRLVAAVNVGERPTFDGIGRRLEAYFLDAGPADTLPTYDWPLKVSLNCWLRDDLKFDDVGSLIRQIDRDCVRTREAMMHSRGQTIARPILGKLQGTTA